MKPCEIKRALISVSDKTGVLDFCRTLVQEFGVELISTGGTAKLLREGGLPVTDVSQITGFPEMLDGRVKTLHPHIHAGILADRSNPEHVRQLVKAGIAPIDLVLVNLYPFEQTIAREGCTFEEAIEQIDIGGPTLLRAAAKNHLHGPVVMCQLGEEAEIVLNDLAENGTVSEMGRSYLAAQVWQVIADYDQAICEYMMQTQMDDMSDLANSMSSQLPEATDMVARLVLQLGQSIPMDGQTPGELLRYGENSHQQGVILPLVEGEGEMQGIAQAKIVQGEMSYNNYVDADAAYNLVQELTQSLKMRSLKIKNIPISAIIKHTNACGVAVANKPEKAYEMAYLGDPISAAGGVLCMNYPVTRQIAEMVMNSYQTWGKAVGAGFFKLDVWMAPKFEKEAVKLITTPTEKRKWGTQVRLLEVPFSGSATGAPTVQPLIVKSISGGLLIQTSDTLGLNEEDWKVVTTHQPTEQQWADLRFAWLVCKHAKSNAITIAKDGQMLGSGVGQTSRVMSCRLAILLAEEYGHAAKLPGSVAASDAFFPVPDGPQKLIDAGVKTIIQPGGGNRDDETRELCEKNGIALVITGTRHFKH